MKLIHAAKDLGAKGRASVAIGFFDGVHLGHQQVIRQTIADARQSEGTALVVTFDRHPNSVLSPQRVPPLLYSLPKKLRTIENLGPDALLLIPFDDAFSRTPGDVFIRGLAHDLGRIQSICVGANFVFGHKRGGNGFGLPRPWLGGGLPRFATRQQHAHPKGRSDRPVG